MLPILKRSVVRAGDPQISAYLHMCTAVLEGETGGITEGNRHCDAAESLLELADNASLRASNLVNRGCLAILDYRPGDAVAALEQARQLGLTNGDRAVVSAANINLAHFRLLAGETGEAATLFQKALAGQTKRLNALGALDGMAKVHLVDSAFDLCAQTLERATVQTSKHGMLPTLYHSRWASLTKGRLLFRQRRFRDCTQLLAELDTETATVGDRPFRVALGQLSALVHSRLGNAKAVAHELHATEASGSTRIKEFQPQQYFVVARVVEPFDQLLAQLSLARSRRQWESQGVFSTRVELDDEGITLEAARRDIEAARTAPLVLPRTAETITNAIAAAIDLSHTPRLAGTELLGIIRALDCSPGARLVEDSKTTPADDEQTIVLSLGEQTGLTYSLVCPLPSEPVKAVLLGDVLRLGRAGVALEAARREERQRGALWPASPVEEQAGALFIAEEMQTLLAMVRRIAPTNAPVLITGETGTGKEVIARTLHGYSDRAGKPFVPFNCSATPRDMLDAQLFGHRKGAFTGATEHFPGVIRAASGGTLFLDEIGETTLDLQPKLLRFLENGEVHPIGETQPTRVNVRVIAATNADLDAMVAQGRFREDLLYRLNIIPLHVPPLRSRREEIPVLAQHYLDKFSLESGKHGLRLSEETVEYLVLYKWPGNVRQLANEMRRMATLADNGAILMPEHLSAAIAASRRTVPPSQRALEPTEVVVRLDQPMPAATDHLHAAMIQHALKKCQGHMEDTAAMLGVSRKGLYLKRQRLGLDAGTDPSSSLTP
ncbi:MAG: sigma-54 dependent transcriptional regulator [Vicinamibacterales bacterium]